MEMHWEVLPQHAYIPDLVSRDFQLFGRREIERGIMKLPEQWL
jgi:hypothetical protein